MAKLEQFISPQIAENLGKELLNIIGNNIKTADTSLYQRKTLDFRDIIDNNFPTMLIIDYNNIKQELKQYQDIDYALKTYIDTNYKPTSSDFATQKFSDKEIELLISAIRIGIDKFSSTSATNTSYKALQTSLSNILENNQNNNTTILQVKQLFNKIYKLTEFSGNIQIFIFPNFANVSNIIRPSLSIGLDIAEQQAGTLTNVDSIGKILAYGHTAAGYIDEKGNTVLNFNSPKCLAVMFDVITSASDKSTVLQKAALQAATFFVNDTRQTEVFINVDKEFSDGFIKTFVSVGGNIVKFENSLVNSRRGSVLEKREKRGQNKEVLKKLASEFSKLQTIVSSRLARYIVNHKKSPNIIEYVKYNITSALKGDTVVPYKSKSKTSNTTNNNISKQVFAGLVKSKVKLNKLSKPSTKPPKASINLTNLQLIINSLLSQKIRENMGTGDRSDILNYRTGRFAQSVKVKEISEGRSGMITAYYTYMKYPYATFSEGGRQQYPRSRDPKLLISKSIREIMQEQMITRMRAVLQ